MGELRRRTPDRGDGAGGVLRPAETARRPLPEVARSGAERLRVLYGKTVGRTGFADRPPRRGATGDTLARHRRAGQAVGDQPGAARPGTIGDRHRRDGTDSRRHIGIPRPAGALPDDTGRAYSSMVSSRSAHDAAPRSKHEIRDGKPDRDKTGPPDQPRVLVDRPAFQDRFGEEEPPDRYGDPLTHLDGTRVPAFNGRPDRDQLRQGALGDCGIIATLGAVAAHRPGDITKRVTEKPDGSYLVSLHETEWTPDGICSATGRVIEMTITRDLPVYDNEPTEPAFAKPQGGAAWGSVLEKAIAGADQAWRPKERADWATAWDTLCAGDAKKDLESQRSGPPPTGYVRLNQGSHPWDRAELLTQLTGQEAAVLECPDKPTDLTEAFARQIHDGKPLLVCSRPRANEQERLPHRLEAEHVYEVVAVTDRTITLRNPWHRNHPEPMTAEQFTANMRPVYTTLV